MYPAVLVETRICGGCLVSRAHKTSLRSILSCICGPLVPLAPDSRPLDCVTQDQWLQTLCTSVQGETHSQSLSLFILRARGGNVGKAEGADRLSLQCFLFLSGRAGNESGVR